MRAIFLKEIKTLFGSWTLWAVAAGVAVAGGLLLFVFAGAFNIFDTGQASLQNYFRLMPWLLMIVIPAFSMRSFSEEEQQGTLFWLFSQPVKSSEMVFGKFGSMVLAGAVMILPFFVYYYTVYVLGMPKGNIDSGVTWANFLGVFFLILLFSSIGIFASSRTKSQILAFMFAILLNAVLYFGMEALAAYGLVGGWDFWIRKFSAFSHYQSFAKGVIEFSDVIYFLVMSGVFLFLASYFVDKKKGIAG